MSPKILARLTVALALGALAAIVPVAMATPGTSRVGTLTISGLTGGGTYGSNDSGASGAIDVYGYSLSVRRPSTSSSSGGGGGAARATPSELSIIKRADRATPFLYRDVAQGKPYASARLDLFDPAGGLPYLTYCLDSVQPVADRQSNDGDGGAAGTLEEGLSLKFTRITITFRGPFNNNNVDIKQGFDFARNVSAGPACSSPASSQGGGNNG
jgi:type VI protein secretion system component Hcp